jgi:hypothetical protein
MEHYRCVKCYFPSSGRERDVDTLEFFPKTIPFPKVTTDDYLRQAATDIISILTTKPAIIPSLAYGDDTKNALFKIATLLGRSTLPPLPLPRVPILPLKLKSPSVVSAKATTNRSKVQQLFQPAPNKTAPSPRVVPLSKPLSTANLRRSPRQHPSLQHSQAIATFRHHVCHIYNKEGIKQTIDTLLAGPDGAIWDGSLGNEFGRLAQGFGTVIGTDTIEFIPKHDVPPHKKVTYGNFICDLRPLKAEKHRVRLTVGGDKLPYEEDAGAPAASLFKTKLLINSTISDSHKGARFMCADLKDHFLATPMKDPEYMRIHYKYFSPAMRQQYNLESIVHTDGYVYIKIKKGMYGLKQAALLAYQHLVKQLAPHGYHPIPNTTGLWQHDTRPTNFCLCVDDFGIKSFTLADANHLLDTLRKYYKISVDWAGKNYCGLTINWNYRRRYVDTSMPGYLPSALKRLQHVAPSSPQYAPHKWSQPAYGQKLQLAPIDDTPSLDKSGTKYVQSCVGSFLYYARALDSTMLPSINEIGGSQAAPTEKTMDACKMLMDYGHTYPNAIVRYYASDMILHVDSDAAYLVLPNARSRYAGHYFLSDHPPPLPTLPNPKPNGAILTVCKTLPGVMTSAAEAETGGVYWNGQDAIACRIPLEALGHPQPPTPLKTDNSTAYSFVHSNIRQRRSKTWDMRWNWLREKVTHKQLRIYWDKGKNNNADYFTKHHPPAHHVVMRPKYVLNAHLVRLFVETFTARPARPFTPFRSEGVFLS